MREITQEPIYVVFMAADTYSSILWDDEGCAIGDTKSFSYGDGEYSLSSLKGLMEWYLQADKYDPYTDVEKFTTVGMEDWINQGYEYAKQIRKMIPKETKLFYEYWHQFGDGHWRSCRAYIRPE